MNFSVKIDSRTYEFDGENPLDISIPINFNGVQPNAYGVEKASSKPCEAGELVGDTRRGGSCNFEQVKFIPHCSGTHTECVGHITRERISVHDSLKEVFIPATLVSVEAENASDTNETYAVNLSAADKLITRDALAKRLQILNNSNPELQSSNLKALIVRILPNDESKLTREYLELIPPFFSTEAMNFIAESGVRHLLVDLPSIDRIFDEGKLSNHRIFWNIEPDAFSINEKSLVHSTITEMIFAPDEIKDGNYLLNLQIAAFVSDASPSRPILFKAL